jgi:5-(carboxyamino)imidazole ribonucleotide synthase
MTRLGILGGGQLGRMLLQQAANHPVETWVLENDEDCPAAGLCRHFVKGDIRDYEAVLAFGRQVDVLTIEIEHVNLEALEALEAEGKRVIPRPKALRIIRDKILQKQYYRDHSIPTSDFRVVQSRGELKAQADFLPAVQKIGMGGYDGRGVIVMRDPKDMEQGFDSPSVLEKLVPIDKELALIVAIGAGREESIYPAVEMVFDPVLNLLDYQICPAPLPEKLLWKAEAVALTVARNFDSPGLFAVELFTDKAGNVYVNETAPRVHNSGHHTIEAHFCSQYEMLLRILLGMPPGNTDMIHPSLMVNLLGEPGHSGEADYVGLSDVLRIDNAFVHIYGKKETRPGRKMGHVTVMSRERQELLHQASVVKRTLKVRAKGA